MKKVLLLLMMLVAMLPAYLQAQDIVEIGTGTTTTYVTPFNSLWGYSFVEQIYTAAEINTAGTITSVSFYHKPSSTTTDQTNNIVLYMKNVSRSTFSSSTDYEQVSQTDIVFTGTWTIPGTEGWTTITLDNPFYYDGSSNLMIAMHEFTSGYSTRYFAYTSATDAVLSYHSDSADPDPYNLGSYSGNKYTSPNRANIQIEIVTAPITCPAPNAPVLSEVTNESATLSWTPRGEESNWDIYITSTQTDVPDSNTVPTDMAADTFYLAEELNSQTTYYFYVRANCDDGEVSRWKGTNFTTTQIMATLPYEQDFEDETENASWALVNGTQTNKWFIGSAINNTEDGENALYISNDDGVTNAYSHTASYVWAYRDIDFTQGAGAYQIDFDWRSVGESANYDYLNVYLGDPAVVTAGNGSIPASAHAELLGNYHNQDTWQHVNINLSSEYAGSKRLYFYWYNDGSGGSNPPAAVDNLSILALNCGFPTHLTIDTITSSSVTIHWHPATEDDDMWNVAVAPYGTSADSAEYITYYDTLQEIGDLDPDTRYVIYVRTNCGSEVSSYVTTSFFTDCEPFDTMPFAESFDTYGTATSSTTANPGPLPNCWTRLTDNTTPYPYISSSQHASGVGSVYFYATSSYYSMLVSKQLDLSSYEANTLNLSFKLLKTSAGYGRMQVGVMTNPNDMSTFVVLKNIYSTDIESTNTWTDFYVTLPSEYADPVYLAFKVPSEATSGVYLDDLLLDETPACSGPRHLSVSQVQGTSVLLNWDEAVFGTPDYLVQYSEQGMDNWSAPVTVTGTTYMLSGLEPSTQYEVRVYADCDGQEADTITGTFLTKCLSGGEVVFDAGSTTTYYVPVGNYYNYSYTQQLFLASELNGATDMRSVSFYYSYGTPMSSKDNVNIYLGHTTQSDFSSTSDWVPVSDLHLVYSGTLNCTQGWNTFAFDSIFHYNGIDNLVLAVDDNSGDYDGSSYVFHSTSTTPDYRAMYYQSDSSNPDPANPSAGTRTYNRSNIKFGADCDSVEVCAAPNVYVTSVSTSEVTINWAPGNTESSWAVEYKMSTDQNWTSEGSVINNTYTFTNLDPGTNYQFRVCALCTSTDSSVWTMTSVFVPCTDIATLPYTQGFESATGSGSSHTVDVCLTRGTNSTTAYPYPSSTYKNSGTYSMYFYGSSSNYAYLALPRMDESIEMNNLMIQFYAYKTSAAYSIEYGVMSDPDNISTFEVLGSFSPSATSTWDMGEFLTNTYTGTGRYIAFRAPQSATSYMYIDDITVDYIPTCPHVTNIHATSIDEVSAVIKWTAVGTETEWAYLYGPAGTVDVTTETPSYVTEDSVELSNLTPNTLYTIYVQAYCDASDQSTWMHYNFRTECPDFFTVPFAENFDEYGTATSSTTTTPGPLPSCWSRLTNYTSPYPYISSSQHASGVGAVYYYATTTYYNMLVSPQLDLSSYAANTLNLSFKLYKTSASYGRFQVGIMTSPTDATTFVALKEINPTDLPTTNTWTDFNVILPTQYTTPVYLAFKAPAEGTNYVYLDDVLLEEAPDCSAPRHLTISQIQGASALVTWEDALFGDPEYVLQYSEQGMDAWSSPVTVTGNAYLISGLEPNTHYEVRVYSDCDGQMSVPATESFVTLCLAGGAVVFDQGTTTNYYVPINNYYHYCYTQEIFLASEMNGATDINSIAFDYAYSSPMTKKTNVKVYLGHTTQDDFASTSSWVPLSNLQLVYSGAMNCTVQGWNTFALDSIFHYNGTDNLVLVIDDNSDQYDGSAYTFRYQSQTPNYRSMYYQSDSSNPDPTNPPTGTRTYNRCNVKFGGECDSVITCVAPNFYVDNVTTNTADIIWVNGYNETAWEMDYKKAVDSVWTPVPNPTGYLVQLTNLQPSTRYNVRMRSDCGGEYSNPVTANFTTECGAISTLPFVDNFDTYGTGTDVYPMCWGKINTYTSGDRPYINSGGFSAPGLLYFFAGSNSYNIAITPEFDQSIEINTLQVSFKYKAYYDSDRLVVGVMTNPDSAATFVPVDTIIPDPSSYSSWSDQVVYLNRYQGNGHFIAFKNAYTTTSCYAYVDNLEIDVMPSCLKPTNLNVTCDNTSATLSWTENGTATGWDIEYGAQGFTPGTGTTVAVTTNPYTITGLASGTVYDFRVRANCGGGDESDWSNMVSATPGSYIMPVNGTNTITMCGGVIYDDGGVSGNYSNSCNSTLVVNPDVAGLFVHLTGTYSIETGTSTRWDYLQIFDGSTTDGTLLFDSHTDNSGNLDVVSTTGPLTVYFHTDASTTYSGFEIQIGCDSAQTPPEPCNAPTNLTVSLSGTNATLDWNQEGTPDNWTISFKQASAAAWSTVTTSTKPYTITDLATDVAYEAFVVANCGEEESNESNHVTFTIVGVNDYVYNTAVYPNPTTGKFRIENSELRIENVEVYDVYGKLITSVKVDDNSAELDLTGNASGTYFARIFTDKGMVTKRIVKK